MKKTMLAAAVLFVSTLAFANKPVVNQKVEATKTVETTTNGDATKKVEEAKTTTTTNGVKATKEAPKSEKKM